MIQEYVLTFGHGVLTFIKCKGVKFTTTPPYAAGTPQYSIDSGVWQNLITDPLGGWKIAGNIVDNGLTLSVGPHDLRLRDDTGEHDISSFELKSFATKCADSEVLVLRVPDLFVAMAATPDFQEYSLNGGVATAINNDPFQVFELQNLSAVFSLAWIRTGAGACTGAHQSFTNPQAITPPAEISPGQFGMKIPWQFWLPLDGVPDVFFDAAKPNDGQNLNTANYSEKQGFEVKVAVIARVRKDGIDTIYQHKSQPVLVSDYGEEPDAVDHWVGCIIETFNENDDNLGGGLLLNGEVTKIKATFEPQAPIDVAEFYGIIRLQVTEQPGYDIWESSTEDGIATGSPLGLITKSDVGGNLVLECETVPANLGSSPYTISAKADLVQIGIPDDYDSTDYDSVDYS